ncbi:hypothetical protein ACHAXT_008172 [Thalassiosira profunda]
MELQSISPVRRFTRRAAAFALALMLAAPSLHIHAFSPSPPSAIIGASRRPSWGRAPSLYAESLDSETLPAPSDMRLREIQSELKERSISYADCFDRESLAKRLVEAREGLVEPTVQPEEKEVAVAEASTEPVETPASDTAKEFDRESTLTELRSLRVKELKVKLSELKVRWGTMIEKEEMVQALCQTMEERFEMSKNFSRSGQLVPGTVGDVEESVLMEELGWLEADVARGVATTASGDAATHPPILLDVYATWCGPCQMVAPFLVAAAEELGPSVRVIKLDSDKYPRISSVLKVGGLPTLIRFDGGDVSKEVQRVEGALMKDQIIDFANGNFNQ